MPEVLVIVTLVVLISTMLGVWGILWSLQKGLNEVVKGLSTIDERLANMKSEE